MFGRRLDTILTLAIVMTAPFAAPANAQTPTPGGSPLPDQRRACPPPSSGLYWIRINVVPNGSSCWFEPRPPIPDLQTYVGDEANWSFCSTCPVDTSIELEGPGGPFGQFTAFFPQPQSDNLVIVDMPRNGWARAAGSNATSDGDWKYNLTLRPAGGGQPLDHIDPRLEIDDTKFSIVWLLERLLLLIAGLLIGVLIVRRRSH